MFKEFLVWAFAVTADGNKKECKMTFLLELMQAYKDGDLTWDEYYALLNIVQSGIHLVPHKGKVLRFV